MRSNIRAGGAEAIHKGVARRAIGWLIALILVCILVLVGLDFFGSGFDIIIRGCLVISPDFFLGFKTSAPFFLKKNRH